MQRYVADGHQAGAFQGAGLPVGAGAGAVGVEGFAVAAGAVAGQVAADQAEVVAERCYQIRGVDYGDGVLEVNDVGNGGFYDQVAELAVAGVHFAAVVELEQYAESVVFEVKLVQVALGVAVEAVKFFGGLQAGFAVGGAADEFVLAAGGLLDGKGLDFADAGGVMPLGDIAI